MARVVPMSRVAWCGWLILPRTQLLRTGSRSAQVTTQKRYASGQLVSPAAPDTVALKHRPLSHATIGRHASLFRRDRSSTRAIAAPPPTLASRLGVLPHATGLGQRSMATVAPPPGSMDADRCQDEYLESLMHRAGELTLKCGSKSSVCAWSPIAETFGSHHH